MSILRKYFPEGMAGDWVNSLLIQSYMHAVIYATVIGDLPQEVRMQKRKRLNPCSQKDFGRGRHRWKFQSPGFRDTVRRDTSGSGCPGRRLLTMVCC